MAQCQCLKSDGNQCTRKVSQNSQFCWQHQSCKASVSVSVSTVTQTPTKSKISVSVKPKISKTKYDFDWRERVIPIEMSGFHVLKLPKGTLLYTGVSVNIPDYTLIDKQYFGNLSVALAYAFSGELLRGDWGKVIIAELTQDVYLLDMSRVENYVRLRQDFGPEIPKYESLNMDVLEYAFKDGLERYSHGEIDPLWTNWMCQTLKFDGWAIPEMPRAHNEVLICSSQTVLKRLPYEFRATIQQKNNWRGHILLTHEGQIIREFGVIKLDKKGPPQYESELRGREFKRVYGGQDDYRGKKDKVSDRYLLDRVWDSESDEE